jgi:histone acetyltransferase
MMSKGQIGPVSTPPNGHTLVDTSRRLHATNGQDEEIKLEDKLDEGQLTRLATGVTVDAGGPTSPAVNTTPFLLIQIADE